MDLANNALPNYGFITPNGCDDAHDCGLDVADGWLQTHIDPLIRNATFQKDGLLIIVFDESNNLNTNGGGRVAAVLIGPYVKAGVRSTTVYQHQNVLRLRLESLGVTKFPGASASAGDMHEFFSTTTHQPPTCTLSVSPTSGPVPLSVTATGTCHDPQGSPLTTQITWGDGSSTNASSGTHSFTVAASYTVKVTATDRFNLSGSASQTVTATTTNKPPTCTLSVSPLSGAVPLSVTATGTCKDPQGSPLTTKITWGDGSSTNASSGTHSFTVAASYTVKVTATDRFNLSGSASQTVTATTTNKPPTCTLSVSPLSGPVPLSVTAKASCTDPQGSPLTTQITWGDGSSTNASSGTHSFTVAASYTVKVTATDGFSLSGSASQTVTATTTNKPPTCTLSVSPLSGPVPLSVTAKASCTDPQGSPLTTQITWGDGSSTNASSGTHSFTVAASYTVKVTATDGFSLSGSASQTV